MLRGERGDTLVEVAIAFTILGAMIAISFGVSNRAVQLGREARLRVQAAQLQQYQAEAIRSYRDSYFRSNPDSCKDNPDTCFADFRTTSFGARFNIGTAPAAGKTCLDSEYSARRFIVEFGTGTKAEELTLQQKTKETGVFKQCILVSYGAGTKTRFDIFITWPGRGEVLNKSVLTTYLDDTKGIPQSNEETETP